MIVFNPRLTVLPLRPIPTPSPILTPAAEMYPVSHTQSSCEQLSRTHYIKHQVVCY